MCGLHGIISNDGAVNALHTLHFSWLLISVMALGTGRGEEQVSTESSKHRSLELKGKLHASESGGKTSQNPVMSTPHISIHSYQDLLVYSNKKWEDASVWLECQFSWMSQYFKILHIKILTYIWWSWFKNNSKPWNRGFWVQGRFSRWQTRLFRVCCQPLLVLWRAGFLIHGNCFNSFEG